MRILTCLGIWALVASCSLLNKVAIKTTSDVIASGSDEVLTEGNWTYFNTSTPANLKMLEGLWFADQSNEKLLSLLIKGHTAYAFGSWETRAMADIILESDYSSAKEQALLHYEKAIFYGLRLMKVYGVSQQEFYDKSFSGRVAKVLSKWPKEHYVSLFYFAQALGSSINLQRDNIAKMANLSTVKNMLNWVCQQKPDLERDSCGLFQAVIEASTPSVLGGSQQKAKAMFLKIIKEQPYNLLARLSYIQMHLIPMLEEEAYALEMKRLNASINQWYSGIKDQGQKNKVFRGHENFNLFNAIAKERYQRLRKIQKEIF